MTARPHRLSLGLAIVVPALLGADQPAGPSPVRAVLVGPGRAEAGSLAGWKTKGATGVAVMLDETVTHERWREVATAAEGAGLALYPWIEVARNPRMADEHPSWMAATGGHHDDWRRRFPTAPTAGPGRVVKAWPWVPIGYAPAFSAHRERIGALLAGLPGTWEGVFLNDLQAGPSSCGCGNDQCRWALDYGTPATAPKAPGADAAARLVAEVRRLHPGKAVVPVWVTECEPDDLADARPSTGLCGTVPCAATSCWPRYAETWDPLLRASSGPIALAAWSETFHRDPSRWPPRALGLFQHPPRGGSPLPDDRTVVVLQAWGRDVAVADRCLELAKRLPTGWVLALDPVEQSWEPRPVDIPLTAPRKRPRAGWSRPAGPRVSGQFPTIVTAPLSRRRCRTDRG